ncbi:hypothetical protein [Streptococcus sp. zg-JUN1979]|uniref:hypothetical protein n=1 Tax=Streptococcus sp. zg-JUN1979 TaxID=3391450 RepID=UPI0039A4E0CC
MTLLLKIGNAIFNMLMVFWLYFAVYFMFQYLTFNYNDLKSIDAKLLILTSLLLVLIFYFREKTKQIIAFIYKNIINHKAIVFLVLVIFQLVITVTSLGLAAADTTVVYNIATNPQFALETDYISIYPNNFLLVIWMKLNHTIFGANDLVALALWNIAFIDVAIVIMYQIIKQTMGIFIANINFVLSAFLLGLSPQYIYTYSDPITIVLLTSLIWAIVQVVYQPNKPVYAISAGVLLAITYGFRPTVMIFMIAGVIVLLTRTTIAKQYFKKIGILLALALCSFMLVNRAIAFALNHQEFVKYEPGVSRTLAYYVNLGLTYQGNIHAEIPQEVAQARGAERNQTALADISKRLDNYTFESFTGHLYYKYYWMIGEGMFGWLQERVLSEETRPNIAWLKKIQDSSFATWVRSYVYVGGDNYYLYGMAMQVVWIIASVGLVFFYRSYSVHNWYQLWMQIALFGALMFLLIFEAGRSRYLLQFIPAVLSVSSIGLYSLASSRKKDESISVTGKENSDE